jgi:hypothetical protein
VPIRVVVSDRDATIGGALAHLVGVAFLTPVIAQAMRSPVSVEVLGDYQLRSSLMAAAMGESFAARSLTNLENVDGVVSVITMTGLSAAPQAHSFVAATGSPVVCLARLRGRVTPDEVPPPLSSVACTPEEAFREHHVPEFSIVEIADKCFEFATIVANEYAG